MARVACKGDRDQPVRNSRQQLQPPAARAVANWRGLSQAWLVPMSMVPVGRPPAGVGNARRGSTHGGTPFGDSASLQGRRLRAQRPQELSPEGQRRPSAHWGSDTYRKGGRQLCVALPPARWRPLDEGRRGGL
ncbi:hypothetical protein B296_00056598, partial [Ensete ventricosum]